MSKILFLLSLTLRSRQGPSSLQRGDPERLFLLTMEMAIAAAVAVVMPILCITRSKTSLVEARP